MIKEKRKEKGLTQSQLAENLVISESYMSKLEKHPHLCNPSVNLILKLAKELDVTPVKIFLIFIEDKYPS